MPVLLPLRNSLLAPGCHSSPPLKGPEFSGRLIKQYFSRPQTPQDNAYVERLIGTIEREFIEQGNLVFDLEEQQQLIDEWLEEYHSFRPHQSLDYLTPNQFYAKLSSHPT